MRVALADVHGNAPALAAVLAEASRDEPDRYVFLGDLTWGSFPAETLELVQPLAGRSVFVRGNADRNLVAFWDRVDEGDDSVSEQARRMVERHTREHRDFLAAFRDSVSLDVEGLGPTCFCHGSPRSVDELVTEATPESRLAVLLDGVEEGTLVTGHSHVSYERHALGKRLLNPGSVGRPCEGRRGAYWALLGPGVDFRRTEYDIDATVERMRRSGEPVEQELAQILLEPPSRAEAVADAESRVFSA